MLKLIENKEEAELLEEFCTDSFGINIVSMLRAYPPEEDICRYWIQITGDYLTAAVCNYNGEVVISTTLKADFEELREFLEASGYSDILCQARDVVSLEMFACGCGQVLRKEDTDAVPFDFERPETTADYEAVYNLLGIKGEFADWFADISRRINKGTADMRIIRRDGKIVSTASLLHIAGDRAVLGAVATDKEYRGQGFATSLVNSFGGYTVYLRCLPALNAFYERMGYKSVDVWAEIKNR
ncbi:MAG: GNAT family N-acetyltransferase [Acutalibacteraceae bacterium]|nr:GNAT family N-acetyltransferase [Acutalibacteraceae bacterium]